MTPRVVRTAKILALVGLAAFVLLRGVVPAWSGIENDFPGYYTAARIVADGGETQRLYDDAWFRTQIRHYGLEDPRNPGKFAPFPPPTALLLLPLTPLRPLAALRVMVIVDLVCLGLATLLLKSTFSWPMLDAALFVLASGWGLLSGLRYGQPYILISTFSLLGYWLYLRGRPWLAGLTLGVFVPVKYFPVLPLAVLAARREWKVALGGTLAILAVVLLSVSVLGWKVHEIFLASVFGKHLIGRLSLEDSTVPFTAIYQSFDALVDRLLVRDPFWNPWPWIDAPALRLPALIVIKGFLATIAAATLAGLARREGAAAAAPAIGVLSIVVLLVAPATATYMFVLLWLPVALLTEYFRRRDLSTAVYVVLGAYALIGFIPYGHTALFEGRGGLSVLAFPRLLLMLALFLASVWFIARPRALRQRNAHAAA